MTFEEALTALKADNKVKRTGTTDQYIRVKWPTEQPPPGSNEMNRAFLYVKPADGLLVPYSPSDTDLFATDWIQLPPSD